jgi:hemerythrin-like metal-binding protein
MALLHWKTNLSLGNVAIDGDHKRLIDLFNRLHFMALAGDDNQAVAEVLDELLTYVRVHFAREEAMMRRCDYPGFAHHRRCHGEFASRLRGFLADFHARPEQFDMTAFYDFLADWLLVHVLDEDMKLVPFLETSRSRLLAHTA